MNTSKTRRTTGGWSARLAMVIAALAASTGCTREFFRNWADQDVTEAVFEKSRDPRFRIDLFTKTPPAMSRFADPYDPDRPPAPPDDFAAQELSPQPQKPTHRLISPAEGTGYLDLLEQWRREEGPRRLVDMTIDTGPTVREEAPPPPESPSPFPLDPNAGPSDPRMSPIPGGESEDAAPPDPRRPSIESTPLPDDLSIESTPLPDDLSLQPRRDDAVQAVALQIPDPLQPGGDIDPRDPFGQGLTPEEASGIVDVPPDTGRDLIDILKPEAIVFDEAAAYGYGKDVEPYIVDGRKILTLALQNSRAYQFQLENLYLQGLAVTLQRFQFMPQFAAGMSPGGPSFGGFAGPNPGNSYLYRTQETGTPASLMNIGTLAGVGKLLSFGTSVTGNFANQTVINFGGPNAVSTTSQSFLPLNLVIRFLRGGGRAFVLEPLTQAERNLLYAIRDFGRFRQEFFVSVLAGGGLSGGGGGDPLTGYLSVLGVLQAVENNTKNVAAYERVLEVFQELSRGAASTVAPLDLVNVEIDLQSQRLSLLQSSVTYRNQLDNFKQQLGLPPDLPLLPDSNLLEGFREVFDEIDSLETKPRPVLEELVQKLPPLEDVVIDGRPVIALYRQAAEVARQRRPIQQRVADRQLARSTAEQKRTLLLDAMRQGLLGPEQEEELRRDLEATEREIALLNPALDVEDREEINRLIAQEREIFVLANERLEDLLRSAQRVALENRLDLMNARAQLYDAWRQLAVTANQLLGVFNTTLSNQFLTPPTTNNPFGFDQQSKQFSLTLQAELPLIRVAERNQFVTAQIAYQRARRGLMQIEDSLKNSLRQTIRNLQLQYQQYEISKTQYVVALVTLDQSFQRFLEPPRSGGGSSAGSQLVLTLLRGLNSVNSAQNGLIQRWVQFQTTRLNLYRDLGIMPYEEWEAFYELFPSASPSAAGLGVGTRSAPAPELEPAAVFGQPGAGAEEAGVGF
ncbi:TolC family protein [Tautonia marina]|uniref:TolC family protein n=1 Tax=Tautonia marina TaxID=2653855 RepID=UPI001261090F|nr:TolC family protein [Tautonia marina]